MINIDEPAHKQFRPAIFRLGFRPFFLFGSIFSVFALGLWAMTLSGKINFQPHGNPIWWHGHEMIFGFVSAIVIGFLLTAVQNWTGQPGLKGWPLIGLFLLWLLGRVALLNSTLLSLPLAASIDLLFLPMASLALFISVYKVKQWRNMIFVPVLLLLTLMNAISYLGVFIADMSLMNTALYGAVIIITFIVALLGGRVIPFFTDRASDWQRTPNLPALEIATIATLALTLVAFFSGSELFLQIASALAGLVIFARWSRWGWNYTFKVPLLWSLHFSFIFIPIGLFLIAAGFPLSIGLHSLTVGGMGGMILAMMARVSLGHTGRQLVPPKPVVFGFALMILATIARITAGLVSDLYLPMIVTAVLFWCIAFGLFILFYASMLMQPRADGRPG
ncbi:NnrS family protein [Parashewanella curva]|uniref:NnrS family protein n=1 Tax=Parashewanella curva TaxID=2338552 RepID=A0A3L8PTP6_9GAMM|nr:NnrS family protein [Parashewanella curva]RLV58780.1 NnrS family protein [Parashewanella curva]